MPAMAIPPVPPEALAGEVYAKVHAQWVRSAAVVHQAPANEIDTAVANMVGMLKQLTEQRAQLEEMAAWLREDSAKLVAIEEFLPEEGGRATLRRIAANAREMAPKYASLAVPEDHPLAVAWRVWIRPFNDAVKAATRALLDTAAAFELRVAEEEAEDAEANSWASRRPKRDPAESTVSLAAFIADADDEPAAHGE